LIKYGLNLLKLILLKFGKIKSHWKVKYLLNELNPYTNTIIDNIKIIQL